MSQNFLITFIGCLSALNLADASGEPCTFDGDQSGTCVPLSNCESAMELLGRIQNGEMQYIAQLQKQHCNINDLNPHVCCPLTGLQILQQTDCGDPSGNRIAHGNVTSPGEFPWMAILGYENQNGEIEFLCGASLITKRYILTAAHCTKNREDSLKVVRLGEHDLSKPLDCYTKGGSTKCITHRDYNIQQVINHPSYNNPVRHNDVALLRLTEEVQINDHIFPVCLPHTALSRNLRFDQNFLIAGWGRTESGLRSDVLLKAEVDNKPIEECQKIYRRAALSDNILCVGSDLKTDTCVGDSGGPVFIHHLYESGVVRYVQYGVVSQGLRSCGIRTFGSVCTNLFNYITWITDNIK